jgi:hypothetical protein
MTDLPECVEGQEAFARFDRTMRAILSVSGAVMKRRERLYRKKVDANPNKRGPKRKISPPVSPDPAV